MIVFPSTGVFSNLGPMGVSLFFVSTIVAQLSYTIQGSGFAGANGSMMIEVVVCVTYFVIVIIPLTKVTAILSYDSKQYSCSDWGRISSRDYRYNVGSLCLQLDLDGSLFLPPRCLEARRCCWILPTSHPCWVSSDFNVFIVAGV